MRKIDLFILSIDPFIFIVYICCVPVANAFELITETQSLSGRLQLNVKTE